MCVFSQEGELPTRQARSGEILCAKAFEHSLGFVGPSDPNVAVCVLNGTRLELRGIPTELRSNYGFKAVEKVVFTIVWNVSDKRYYDAFRFEGGYELQLVHLRERCEGMTMLVEAIPVEEGTLPEPELPAFVPSRRPARVLVGAGAAILVAILMVI